VEVYLVNDNLQLIPSAGLFLLAAHLHLSLNLETFSEVMENVSAGFVDIVTSVAKLISHVSLVFVVASSILKMYRVISNHIRNQQ
jgi:hypothetical protein